jgi:hypothetical protein
MTIYIHVYLGGKFGSDKAAELPRVNAGPSTKGTAYEGSRL